MQITPTTLQDAFTIKPQVFGDDRGYFFESFKKAPLQTNIQNAGITVQLKEFVQDNESKSNKGILRGLHFQRPGATQSKLVRVLKGTVQDVIVDIRTGSPTYGKWESFILSEENKMQLFVPRGFAHGFLTLENDTIFVYKTDDYYAPELDGGLRFNDPNLAITWELPESEILANDRDRNHPTLNNFESTNPFIYGEI